MTSFRSISTFAEQISKSNQPVHALINNAGVFYANPENTADGFDVTFQTNYLGVFLLTLLLLPVLKKDNGARIVNLSSAAHNFVHTYPKLEYHKVFDDCPENRFQAYGYSKFCLVLFSVKLSKLLYNTNVSVHCVDPGNVETNIFHNFPPLAEPWRFYLQKPIRVFVIKRPLEAAQSVLHALLAPEPGFYIKGLEQTEEYNPDVQDLVYAEQLWIESRKACAAHLSSTK